MKKYRLYRFIYVGLVFLFLYPPYIRIAGIVVPLPYLIPFFLSLLFFYIINKASSLPRTYFILLTLYWIGGLWIFFIGLSHGNIDRTILFGYFPGTLSILAAPPIVRIFAHKISTDHSAFIIKSIYLAGLIHGIIMILAFFLAPFRDLLYSIVVLGDQGKAFVEYMIRAPGLTTAGGDGLSVIQALTLIFGIYYFLEVKRKSGLFQIVLYTSSFLILLTSILLAARTGLIIFFIFIIGWLFLRLIKFFRKLTLSRIFLSKISVVTLIFVISVPLGFIYLMNSEYSRFANRAFELFLNYFEQGEFTTSSTQNLEQMYFLPTEGGHLFAGDGNFGRDQSLPKISSDVGYVRMIFGVGIFGFLLLVLPLFYSLFLSVKHFDSNRHVSMLLAVTVLTIVITNFKVMYYFEFRECFKILFLLVSCLAIINPDRHCQVQ